MMTWSVELESRRQPVSQACARLKVLLSRRSRPGRSETADRARRDRAAQA